MKEMEFHLEVIEMIKLLKVKRKIILATTLSFTLISIIICFSIPKQYTVNIELATESSNNTSSTIGNMVSILGIGNLNNNNEALNTGIYSDIISSTPFLLEIINSKVKYNNSIIPFEEYINNQKKPWWESLKNIPLNIFSKNDNIATNINNDIKNLNAKEIQAINKLKESINTEMRRKTNIFSISVCLQNPTITAIIADSVANKLQKYVSKYRTNKAINDYKYLETLYNERKADYYKAQQAYANYIDMNRDITSQRATVIVERLRNEMNLTFQIYSQIATQLELAKAKIQEQNPIFTIIEPAYIPKRPSAPNKKIIVIGFTLLGFSLSSIYFLIKNSIINFIKKIIQETK